MFSLVLRSLWRAKDRATLMLLGLLVIGSSFALLTSTSQTTVLTTEEELSRYWRTSYDILVRPPGSVDAIENEYGLLRANYLSGLYGGISIEQYETIKNLTNVEVAAPIAMIGYMTTRPGFLFELQEGRLYRVKRAIISTDNVHQYRQQDEYYPMKSSPHTSPPARVAPDKDIARLMKLADAGLGLGVSAGNLTPGEQALFLLAGIEPEQEAQLIDFSEAIINGRYLEESDRIEEEMGLGTITLLSGETFTSSYRIPLLINSHIYEQQTASFEVDILDAPDATTLVERTLEQGKEYLGSLPVSRHVFSREITLTEAYQWLFDTLQRSGRRVPVDHKAEDVHLSPFGFNNFHQPSPVAYREQSVPSLREFEPVLEAVPTGVVRDGQVIFRRASTREFKHPHNFNIVGTFDMAKLRDPYSTRLNAVPLETYYPPIAIRRYDEIGNTVEPATLIPTLNEKGYILRPPYALTTIEGARLFAGDNCISAIRVRVKGVEELNERSQALIEEVAKQIYDATGLHVDITLGSSPKQLLVHIPGYENGLPVGYVEEGWVQKGVSISIHRGFNKADLLFFAAMFLVCGLYVLNSSLLAALARRRELGLMRALGWRSKAILRLLLSESTLLALTASLLGALLSLGAIAFLHLEVPRERALLILPLGLGLYLAGSIWPALKAARTPPVTAIQAGELGGQVIRLGQLSITSYGVRNTLRRRSRTLLSLLSVTISVGLVTFFLLVSVAMEGLLYGTLLGEHISLQIQGYHYVMATICFAVSAIVIADIMLMNVAERRREIGILKAIGWRSGDVFKAFVLEAAMLGMMGGILGWATGMGAFWALYGMLPPSLLWIAPVGLALPTLVSAIAALYPARQAAQITPARTVRCE